MRKWYYFTSCSKKGANVLATDINETALNYLEKNAKENNLTVEIIHSDLFDSITKQSFDYIIINPPYYPKKPKTTKEKAWFCGENFEYFEKLFYQLQTIKCSTILMILSEDCNIEKIKSISHNNKLNLSLIKKIQNNFEINFIFKILKN